MTLSQQFESWADHLRATKSQRTRHNYTCRVRTYLRTLTSDDQFTTLHVRAYKDRLGDALRPRAVASHVAALRSFGDYLVEIGHLSANPVAPIRAPKLDKPRRDTPTDDQIGRLFDATLRIYRPYRRRLAVAVLSVLTYAGLRRDELLGLRLTDIDFRRGVIEVRHGKGDKPRTVPMLEQCRDALADYLEVRPECDHSALWLLRQSLRLGDNGLRELLREAFAAADMPNCRALLPHSLRHAFATRLDQAGVSLKKIGAILGHADVSTTSLYVHAELDSLQAIIHHAALKRSAPAPEPPVDRPALRLVDDTKKERPAG